MVGPLRYPTDVRLFCHGSSPKFYKFNIKFSSEIPKEKVPSLNEEIKAIIRKVFDVKGKVLFDIPATTIKAYIKKRLWDCSWHHSIKNRLNAGRYSYEVHFCYIDGNSDTKDTSYNEASVSFDKPNLQSTILDDHPSGSTKINVENFSPIPTLQNKRKRKRSISTFDESGSKILKEEETISSTTYTQHILKKKRITTTSEYCDTANLNFGPKLNEAKKPVVKQQWRWECGAGDGRIDGPRTVANSSSHLVVDNDDVKKCKSVEVKRHQPWFVAEGRKSDPLPLAAAKPSTLYNEPLEKTELSANENGADSSASESLNNETNSDESEEEPEQELSSSSSSTSSKFDQNSQSSTSGSPADSTKDWSCSIM